MLNIKSDMYSTAGMGFPFRMLSVTEGLFINLKIDFVGEMLLECDYFVDFFVKQEVLYCPC